MKLNKKNSWTKSKNDIYVYGYPTVRAKEYQP